MSAFVSISANPAAWLEAVQRELPVISQDETGGQEPSAEGQQKQPGSSHLLKHSRICKKEHLSVASTTCEVWMLWCRKSPAPSSTSYTTQLLLCADTMLYAWKSASEPNSSQHAASSNIEKSKKINKPWLHHLKDKPIQIIQIYKFENRFGKKKVYLNNAPLKNIV